MTAREWLDRFAGLLGTEPPSDERITALLDLAATAAHDSERIAAPIACYMAGLSDRPIEDLQEIARQAAGT
ncbi:MAG: hypothetical protein QOG62_2169 [Thermoleophilaceae bacterium]|jgi:hypothetical protein|nr:hypothetical protein [Thermoleophilaceae bacterium]